MDKAPRLRETILQVAVLSAFALAQPLYELVGRHPGFLVAHRAGPAEIAGLAFLLSVLMPALLALPVCLAGLAGERAGARTGAFLVAAPASLLALQVLKRLPHVPAPLLLAAACAAGTAAAWALRRTRAARLFALALAPSVLVFPAAFLLGGPVRSMLLASRVELPPHGAAGAELPPVVFVLLDEFPVTSLMDAGRRIDAARCPNFAALARDSIWFRNATAVGEDTLVAVPALLTGRFPKRPPGLPTWSDYPRNLFTFLSGTHEMRVTESHTMLCPPELCPSVSGAPGPAARLGAMARDLGVVYLHLLAPDELARRLPPIDRTWRDFAARTPAVPRPGPSPAADPGDLARVGDSSYLDRRGIFRDFIGSISPSPRPALHFLHVMLPHQPWAYLPSGRAYAAPNEKDIAGLLTAPLRWSDDPFFAHQALQRHLLQVGFTDRLLGELVERLKTTGLYEKTLMVVTADHGASFRPGDLLREMSGSNAAGVLPVPLFVKLPGRGKERISDRNVEAVDVLPTIADALGLALPWPVDGASALDEKRAERPYKTMVSMKRGVMRFPKRFDEKYRALRTRLRLFGAGGEPDRLYRLGPYGALVGERPERFAMGPDAGARVRFEQAARSGASSPWLSGRVTFGDGPERRLHLAVALGGTIRAVTRTHPPENGGARFSVMLPEHAVLGGSAAPRVFVVSEGDRGPALSPARRGPGAFVLDVSADGGRAIAADDGTRYPVQDGRLRGHVDRAFTARESLVLRGWAVDVRRGRPPASILVFADGRFVYAGETLFDRPKVARSFGKPGMLRSGFQFHLPMVQMGDLAKAQVRLFALSSDGAAGELTYWKP
ncbi:MAG: sulfatase-like hydrolase/transferase [Elusimicrobiota bacterium]